jgi:hypothetical protein
MSAARKRMQPVHVIVLCGTHRAYRSWVQAQIDTARLRAEPILAARPRGDGGVPHLVEHVGVKAVAWDARSIVHAIGRQAGERTATGARGGHRADMPEGARVVGGEEVVR